MKEDHVGAIDGNHIVGIEGKILLEERKGSASPDAGVDGFGHSIEACVLGATRLAIFAETGTGEDAEACPAEDGSNGTKIDAGRIRRGVNEIVERSEHGSRKRLALVSSFLSVGALCQLLQ